MEKDLVTDTVKTEGAEQEVANEVKKVEKTFTQDQFNSAIAGEKRKLEESIRTSIMEEMKAKESEAQRLAGLKESERQAELLKIAKEERDSAKAQLNAYQLKDQTIKDNGDIPMPLIDLIDFKIYNTAEMVEEKLKTIREVYKKSVETGVNENFKEKTPKTVVGQQTKTYPTIPNIL